MGRSELGHKLGRFGISYALTDLLSNIAHVGFALLKCQPALFEQLRPLAWQQRILPLLHLLLEVGFGRFDAKGIALAGHHILVESAKTDE
jgi:hypothetical protein